MNSSSVRSGILSLVILCLVVLVWFAFRGNKNTGSTPQFSELYNDVKAGKVESAKITPITGEIEGKMKNGDVFHSTVPPGYNDFTTLMLDKGVVVKVERS